MDQFGLIFPFAFQSIFSKMSKWTQNYCTHDDGAQSGSDSDFSTNTSNCSKAEAKLSFTISSSKKCPYKKLMRSSEWIISWNSSSYFKDMEKVLIQHVSKTIKVCMSSLWQCRNVHLPWNLWNSIRQMSIELDVLLWSFLIGQMMVVEYE